ncbi:hypothetical protein [Pontimicrobium sp. MEBiC06410]
MKTLKLLPLFLIAFLFCNHVVVAQEDEEEEIIEEVSEENQEELSIITAIYRGIDDGMFTFSYKDEEGEEIAISFNKLSLEAKRMFDLNKKEMIGEKFEITYSSVNEEEEDDDDEVDYTIVKTILKLKKL